MTLANRAALSANKSPAIAPVQPTARDSARRSGRGRNNAKSIATPPETNADPGSGTATTETTEKAEKVGSGSENPNTFCDSGPVL